MLPLPQARYGVRVSRVASQMKTADPFDRYDSAGFDKRGGGRDRIAARFERHRPPVSLLQPNFRAANGAGIWLSVEAAVRGLPIFGKAVPAHLERRHARRGAVIGDGPKDRKPGAAKRAIRKRIAIAPVRGVANLGQAGRAGGRIRDDAGCDGAAPARHDPEIRWRSPGQRGRFDRVDPGEGRDFGRERGFELDERRRISKDADQHAVAVVPHNASQPEALCDPPDRGPEPYALHEAADPDGYSLDTVYCVQPPPSQCTVQPCMDRRSLPYVGRRWASLHLFVPVRRQRLACKRGAFLARRGAKNSKVSAMI